MNLQDAEQIIGLFQQVRALKNDLGLVISYLNQDGGLDEFVKLLQEKEQKQADKNEEKLEEEEILDDGSLVSENGVQEEAEINPYSSSADATTLSPPELPPSPPPPPPPPAPVIPAKPKSMAKILEERMMKKRPQPKEYKV